MFGLDDIVGGLFGGSGGGTSVTSTTNIGGTDKPISLKVEPVTVTQNSNMGGTDKPIALKVEPLTVTETATANVGGTDKPIGLNLEPLTVTENLGGTDKPIGVDLRPVTLNENIDLKPVAVDTCQTLKLAPLPETEVCQPYRHHVAYTLFGVEYLGISYDGESKQLIDSPRRPQVIERSGHREPRRATSPTVFGGDRGIRVRVLDPDE